MHISEGILSGPVLLTGWALSAGGLAIGLRRLKEKEIPKVAVLTSAFFVASLVHIPVGPASAHLLLIGLTGLLLGWVCFPVMFVGLLLQAILFQYGGVVVLGINNLVMALPGVIVHYMFRPWINVENNFFKRLGAFLAGVLGIFISALLCSLALILTKEAFWSTAKIVVLAHLPVMLLEGILTVLVIAYIERIRPELIKKTRGVE